MITIVEQPIDYRAVVERVRHRNAGAVCLFLGTAREFTGLRQTTLLEYEAYRPMADQKLAEIEAEARRRWPIIGFEIVHRVGRIDLGEIAVAVAVSTPHRAASFEAGQWAMDTLKAIVPIWKKECWADGGAEWIHQPGDAETREGR